MFCEFLEVKSSERVTEMKSRLRAAARFAAAFVVAFFAATALAKTLSAENLGRSSRVDTEVTRYIPFDCRREDMRKFNLDIELNGGPSNDVEVAFGADANRNGVLEPEETGIVFGWRAGRCFLDNVAEGARYFAGEIADAVARRLPELRVRRDGKFNLTRMEFGDLAYGTIRIFSGAEVPWVWKPDWNLMRFTRRGVAATGERMTALCKHEDFVLRIR